MSGTIKAQTCPYCHQEVEDYEANWEFESEEEVECDNCHKTYVSKPQYIFDGWLIEKQCEQCGEWTDDGMVLCDCEDED
ncbi:hypothetical protein KO561_05220 [Radiobacillus kanasensis]|uniref:cytochrome c3 family protein n=1 Tax=Radiobacillus kanasensis TaxID=2844358 RepID=UPI001E385E9D|nr:cytochrome c3 family protein [Radiobacillus kanasensis]UFU00351.1 hypothetical protein KO561_05220 [Radiobacillus kanasensis]